MEEHKVNIDIKQSMDALGRCSAIMLYEKRHKNAILVGIISMLYLWLTYQLLGAAIIYQEYHIMNAVAMITLLLLFAFLIYSHYAAIKHKKLNKFLLRIWMLKKNYPTFEQINETITHYDFQDEALFFTSSHSPKTKRYPYRKIRRLYLTPDYIYARNYVYIERNSLAGADYLKLQQFLEGKVPKKYIRHAII